MNTKTKAANTAQGKDKTFNKWATMYEYGKFAFVAAGMAFSAMKCQMNWTMFAFPAAFFAAAMAFNNYFSSMMSKKECHTNPMFHKFYVAEVYATMAFFCFAQFFMPANNYCFFGMLSCPPMFTQQNVMGAFCNYFTMFFTTTMGMMAFKKKFSSSTCYFMMVAACATAFKGYFLYEATKKMAPMMFATMATKKFFTMSFFNTACVWAYVKYSWFCNAMKFFQMFSQCKCHFKA